MNPHYAKTLIQKTKDDYNLIADKFSGTRHFPWSEFEIFKKYIKSGDKVLDVGCGNGRLGDFFKNFSVQYTGVDISEKLMAKAKARYAEANFFVADMLNLPFRDEEFNLVFNIASLYHIPSSELREQAVSEMKRVLKKEGKLIILTWNLWQKKFWPLLFKYTGRKILGQSQLDFKDIFKPWKNSQGEIVTERYAHAFTLGELRGLVKKQGLKVVEVGYTKKGRKAGLFSGYNIYLVGS